MQTDIGYINARPEADAFWEVPRDWRRGAGDGEA